MATKYHFVHDGRREGPVEAVELLRLEEEGLLRIESLVWRPGLDGWQALGSLREEVVAAADTEAVPASGGRTFCPHCRRLTERSQLILVAGNPTCCASCKDEYVQRKIEGAPTAFGEASLEYAGFWIRALAKIIDSLLIGVFSMVLVFLLGLVAGVMMPVLADDPSNPGAGEVLFVFVGLGFYLLFFAAVIGYSVFFVGHPRYQATPGKLVLGLKVITEDGSRVSYGRATGRYFAEMLNGFTMNIGYLIAAFDEEKRTLHDHICNTRVIYKR